MRTAITGWPNSGKTTYAVKLSEWARSTDALKHLPWSEVSLEASKWFDQPGEIVIEGVAVPRALRKWQKNNPGKDAPIDKLIVMTGQYREITPGHEKMGKGIDTVLAEIEPWLRSSGVVIEYRN